MNKKYFFVSIICSLLTLALIIGLSIVEKNTRAVVLDESPSFISYSIIDGKIKNFRLRFIGQEIVFNL